MPFNLPPRFNSPTPQSTPNDCRLPEFAELRSATRLVERAGSGKGGGFHDGGVANSTTSKRLSRHSDVFQLRKRGDPRFKNDIARASGSALRHAQLWTRRTTPGCRDHLSLTSRRCGRTPA